MVIGSPATDTFPVCRIKPPLTGTKFIGGFSFKKPYNWSHQPFFRISQRCECKHLVDVIHYKVISLWPKNARVQEAQEAVTADDLLTVTTVVQEQVETAAVVAAAAEIVVGAVAAAVVAMVAEATTAVVAVVTKVADTTTTKTTTQISMSPN